MAQASSVLQDNTVGLLITGSVLQDNIVGSLQAAVMAHSYFIVL